MGLTLVGEGCNPPLKPDTRHVGSGFSRTVWAAGAIELRWHWDGMRTDKRTPNESVVTF
jgi:hypothetical protein